MNAKDFIYLNNKKREELSKANEEYYDKMLVYIRSHLFLSEQQTEELLMELLDHLLDAQAQGKSAEDVFGEDPVAYCDEMIKQLPKEKTKSTLWFVGYLIFYLAGWFALIRGLTLIAIQKFVPELDQTIYLGTASVSFMIAVASILFAIWLIFTVLKKSISTKVPASNPKLHQFKLFLSFFIIFVVCTGVIFFVPATVPSFGVAVEISWYVYVITGVLIVAAAKLLDRKYRITK